MADLSPAVQAVLIAEAKSRCLREERGCHPNDQDWNGCYVCVHRRGLAAALRAAADQVVPHSEVMPQQDLESRREAMVWGMVNQTQVTRQQLLAIAAELEGSND